MALPQHVYFVAYLIKETPESEPQPYSGCVGLGKKVMSDPDIQDIANILLGNRDLKKASIFITSLSYLGYEGEGNTTTVNFTLTTEGCTTVQRPNWKIIESTV